MNVEGIQYRSFKRTAEALGLLENNKSIKECLEEATLIKMATALRKLFVFLQVFCHTSNVDDLWQEFKIAMAEDYRKSFPSFMDARIEDKLLRELNDLLGEHHKKISDYGLPELNKNYNTKGMCSLFRDEQEIRTPEFDLSSKFLLNKEK
ncbi:hypothetical protein GIB67_039091 [Kingdonia uniflora]|uniref:Uncharacterized protein n=1 Tax=Kingdonia uniflora TaxID=39325 RepID=A0A7J7LLA4_9MAGN|nr:hypothetical protein GIB67_039091 [Kingdonia uniflora]